MSWKVIQNDPLPKRAASAVGQYLPVKTHTTKDYVILAASNNDYLVGITVATAASPGDPVAVYPDGNVVPAICGASVGAGGEVGVASTNGALGPVAAASGFRRFVVGEAQENAAAGTTFSVLIRIRELTGTAY